MSAATPSPWSPLSRATVAAVLSAVLPGAGSYYLGRAGTAAALLGLEIVGSLTLALLWRAGLLPAAAFIGAVTVTTAVSHLGGAGIGAVEAWRGRSKRAFLPAVGYMVLTALLLVGMQRIARDNLVATYFIATIAMEPSLQHGDRILARPRDARAPYRRGEVVAILDPERNDSFVRRLIGLPGDRVRIEGAEVMVNDASLRDGVCTAGAAEGCFLERSVDGLRYPVLDRIGSGEVHLEVTVPADAVFVLRDRRDVSIPLDPFPRTWLRAVVTDVWWSYTHRGVELDRIGVRVSPDEAS